jgi:hypothetical protein
MFAPRAARTPTRTAAADSLLRRPAPAAARLPPREAAPGRPAAWDLTGIAAHARDRTDRPGAVVQAKLAVGRTDDPLEHEADRIAERVLRLPDRPPFSGAPPPSGQAPARGGQPLDPASRAFFEPRFGTDFGAVRVHADTHAARSAALLGARAFTHGQDIFYGAGERPGVDALTAHELTHVVQQAAGGAPDVVRRYGEDSTAAPVKPTVKTMQEFIDLVAKVEAANPGLGALQIAQMIMRSKYHSTAWDWLLPSSANTQGVAAGGKVTADDAATLASEFTVTLPQGGDSDPSHIVAGIVAKAETQAPGAGGAGGWKGKLAQAPPAGLTQVDIATWAGDPGSAAGEWMTAHPLANGRDTMQDYMDEFSPESDMMGDVDGVAINATSTAAGFVFNPTAPLSDNLHRFYFPAAANQGKNRRFHTFINVLGFTLQPDKVTLSSATELVMDSRIHDFADWYTKNDPDILKWMMLNSQSGGIADLFMHTVKDDWIARANDWTWFAKKFRDFVQRNLTAEGP